MAAPLKTAAIVIYATLLLLWLTIPQGMTNFLQGLVPNPVQQALLEGAQTIRAAVQTIGLDAPYAKARAFFLHVTHKDAE
jgi:hypothetical protein